MAGLAVSAAWGCRVWIGGGGACAGGVQGRRGGARRGAVWEGRLEASSQGSRSGDGVPRSGVQGGGGGSAGCARARESGLG